MRILLDDRVISERYFFPRNDAPSVPWVVETSGQRLACIRAAKQGGPAVLHFRGNGEVASDWSGDFADALSAAGIDAYFGEYRCSCSTPAVTPWSAHGTPRLSLRGPGSVPSSLLFKRGDHNSIHAFNGDEIVRRVITLARR